MLLLIKAGLASNKIFEQYTWFCYQAKYHNITLKILFICEDLERIESHTSSLLLSASQVKFRHCLNERCVQNKRCLSFTQLNRQNNLLHCRIQKQDASLEQFSPVPFSSHPHIFYGNNYCALRHFLPGKTRRQSKSKYSLVSEQIGSIDSTNEIGRSLE